ncbi:MAG: GDP-mannose 4,6-dehydratase, partial [Bacteroidota bacterium]
MKILLTGGAGFIGSNLCEALLANERISLVRVLDNLSTGLFQNILEFTGHPKFQFINGDVRNIE